MTTTQTPTQPTVWNKAAIHNLLDTSEVAVERALLVLYARQTAQEQRALSALEENNKGFNKADSGKFSSFAQVLLKGYHLSSKQLGFARRRMKKYWKQLLEEAASKGAKVSYK